jgi:long-chain fatty acid transport protein
MTRPTIIGALLLTVLPSTAFSAGFYALDEGIRAIGRAGAFTAGADDLTAQYYNAAALKNQTGTAFMFDLAAVQQAVTFDHRDITDIDEADYNYDPVKNQALPMPVPTISFGRRMGEKLVLAVGLYTPYGASYKYDPDGAQRYSLVDATMLQTNIGPSMSYEITDTITLGLGVAGSYFSVDQSLKSSLNFDPSYDPQFDATFLIEVVDPFTITSNVGLLIEPPSGKFAVGVSFNPPTTYNARGAMSGDFSENSLYTGDAQMGKQIDADSASDDDVSLTVTMPAIAKVGFLIRPTDRLELEADFVWQGWSSVQSFTITDVELTVPTTLKDPIVVTDDVGLPAQMEDAWSIRLGAEFDQSERLALRTGLFYETSAVPDATRSVFLPDANKFGYGLGASWGASERLTLDFGFSQAFAPTHTIATSLAYQVNVDTLTNEIGTGATVGNGDFGFVTTIAGLGATWAM